jgi:hypothetical protein
MPGPQLAAEQFGEATDQKQEYVTSNLPTPPHFAFMESYNSGWAH